MMKKVRDGVRLFVLRGCGCSVEFLPLKGAYC
jgi:hypothetical protein